MELEKIIDNNVNAKETYNIIKESWKNEFQNELNKYKDSVLTDEEFKTFVQKLNKNKTNKSFSYYLKQFNHKFNDFRFKLSNWQNYREYNKTDKHIPFEWYVIRQKPEIKNILDLMNRMEKVFNKMSKH